MINSGSTSSKTTGTEGYGAGSNKVYSWQIPKPLTLHRWKPSSAYQYSTSSE